MIEEGLPYCPRGAMTRQNIWLLQSGMELICKWDYSFSSWGPYLKGPRDAMFALWSSE
jgi:hypothetical protein